ncbi:MAG: hypothetical protein E6Q97_01655 [Desulfurellales bacterium]|nr:MAG: hypothetical protein E6Q97_01655 [Desulfurellales bacterium]
MRVDDTTYTLHHGLLQQGDIELWVVTAADLSADPGGRTTLKDLMARAGCTGEQLATWLAAVRAAEMRAPPAVEQRIKALEAQLKDLDAPLNEYAVFSYIESMLVLRRAVEHLANQLSPQ